MPSLLDKLFGSTNERKVKKLEPIVDEVLFFEEDLRKLSDAELRAKTAWFKSELNNRERDPDPKKDFKLEQEALDLILPEAFAVVREAGRRVLGMRHYDVQLIGGYVLHKGGIAEMRTGEGKTLVATLPAYLNALTGKGVHVVTVNDYLAQRDAEWMGQLYRFLGLSVGVVLSGGGFGAAAAKKAAYAADITYGTNNEFGFDYLRDNMATSKGQLSQRPFNYAIIDEVDSILIDEARTPLIISGRLQQSAETYETMARLAPQFEKEVDYTVDEKAKNVILTEEGIDKAQTMLGLEDLFTVENNLAHHLLCALKAKEIYRKDIEYVVKNDQVMIVDEFTGRLMDGRRWSDGLHQAVEAKEGVPIQDETQTLASITYQNLFRLYPKLSGMTGTALTEEEEFRKIYNLEVTAIPTNRPDVRVDYQDLIFKNESIKFFKVAESIIDKHLEGRPVLVGTTSIEKSELVSALLSNPAPMEEHLRQKAEKLLGWLETSKKPELYATLKPLLETITEQASTTIKDLGDTRSDIKSWPDFAYAWDALGKSVEALEAIRRGIPHAVLNAKLHEQEAYIVAQAGRPGAVTIATNMAGRGTDILLGGNPEFMAREALRTEGRNWLDLPEEEWKALVAQFKVQTDAAKQAIQEAGGLHIIGTERHESRRIDNQLRGRAARQGDPGSTQFFLSLSDPLMRLFAGMDRIAGLMDFLAVDESLPITAPIVSRVIEGAQAKVEAYHFDIRKNILQYDDVMTEQRRLIYEQRRKVLDMIDLRGSMLHIIDQAVGRFVANHFPVDMEPEERNDAAIEKFQASLAATFPPLSGIKHETVAGIPYWELVRTLQAKAFDAYEQLEKELSRVRDDIAAQHGVNLRLSDDEDETEPLSAEEEAKLSFEEKQALEERRHPLRTVERNLLLSVVDQKWIEYLHRLDVLREGIGLRAYGQKDPLIEYKREAYDLFQNLTYEIQDQVATLLFRSQIQIEVPMPSLPEELEGYGLDMAMMDGESGQWRAMEEGDFEPGSEEPLAAYAAPTSEGVEAAYGPCSDEQAAESANDEHVPAWQNEPCEEEVLLNQSQPTHILGEVPTDLPDKLINQQEATPHNEEAMAQGRAGNEY